MNTVFVLLYDFSDTLKFVFI